MNDHYHKAQSLLSQALNVAMHSLGNGQHVQEAKQHMKIAFDKLEHARGKKIKKKQQVQTEQEKWWSNIIAGTAKIAMSKETNVAMSQETYAKTLYQLNSMIDEEKIKLDELENKTRISKNDDTLLSD